MTAPDWREPMRHCVKLDRWPEPDRQGWRDAIRAGSLLLDDGPGASLRPVTLKRHAASYGRWLGFLERCGRLDPAAAPSDRATPERVRAYIAELQALNASGTVLVRLRSLVVVLGWLAPDRDWSWLRPILARLEARVRPARNKNARLRGSDELVHLGRQLMAEAELVQADDRGSDACRYRDGLMIALLARHPLRLANLAGLELARQLRRDAGSWWIELEAADTKNRQPYLVPLAQDLIAPIERYLGHWRPQLAGPVVATGSTWLWLSREGTRLSHNHAHFRICRHTAAAFGQPVNPHLFRDALATTVAVRRPELIGIVTPLLGHHSIATAQRHYNRAGMTSAAEAWHDVLDQLSRD